MWMRQTVFFNVAYRDLSDHNKWRHWVGAEYKRTMLFRNTVLNCQAPRVICFAPPSQTGRPLELFFYKKKGSGLWLPKAARRRSSKHVYKSTTFRQERLMGEIGCQRPHSTKLVDIHLEIFVESALDVCIYLWGTQWRHGSPLYCLLFNADQTLHRRDTT